MALTAGTWDEAYHRAVAARSPTEARGKKYFSHFFANGDHCAETGRPRAVQVRLVCTVALQGGQLALSLTEPSTCQVWLYRPSVSLLQYLLTAKSALFCDMLEEIDEHGLVPL